MTILIAAAMPVLGQSPGGPLFPPPQIVVTGNAQIEVEPDEASVRLGVVRQASNAQSAQDQANTAATTILDAIAKLGIPAARIRTSRLTLTPVYAQRRPEISEAPRIAAYSASNVVSVELDDLTLVGPVIDAGLKAGANQVDGVHFRLKNDAAAREQALKQAAAEARRKAEVLAGAMGVRLGGIQEVSEGGVSVLPRGDYGGVALMAREATPTPVSPGQIDVHANVTVRYRIQEK